MKKTIYCKTVGKDEQAFYVQVGGKNYYLFNQKFYRGVKEYFGKGVDINNLASAVKHHNTAIMRTAEKIPSYISYIEKEYEVSIFDKTNKTFDKRKQKVRSFNWRIYDFEAI